MKNGRVRHNNKEVNLAKVNKILYISIHSIGTTKYIK